MALKPLQVEEYHVFLASPGDLDLERQAVRRFFDEYNRHTAGSRGIRFTVIDYENYATAGIGRPQELITSQTLEKYRDSLALVVGLMGQRFGSPTGTHESGTEEEFEWALNSYRQTGFPEIKWFFRKVDEFKAPSDPKRILEALGQWEKVRAFRERLETGSSPVFYKEFTDTENFRDILREDLSLWLNAQERPWVSAYDIAAKPMVSQVEISPLYGVVAPRFKQTACSLG